MGSSKFFVEILPVQSLSVHIRGCGVFVICLTVYEKTSDAKKDQVRTLTSENSM